MKKDQDFASVLHAVELKATPARLALLAILEKSSKPLNIKQIQSLLKDMKIDQVTIYRALELLKKAGIVKQIDLQKGHAYYELVDTSDHHHIICTDCGRVDDFSGCNFVDLEKKALKQNKSFKKITQHSLELFGLCQTCSN